MSSKTGGSLKLFDQKKIEAAQPFMEDAPGPTVATLPGAPIAPDGLARYRKAGGRKVRISGYVPDEVADALRDEVIRRMNATRKTISVNDVLCSILTDWVESRRATL